MNMLADAVLGEWDLSLEDYVYDPDATVFGNQERIVPAGFNGQSNPNSSEMEIATALLDLSTTSTANDGDGLLKTDMLLIKNRTQVERLYKREGLFGLFSLFLTKNLKESIIQWTNERLGSINEPLVSLDKFHSYLGLELAASRVPLNSWKEYWSKNPVVGQEFFKTVMP